MPYNSQLCHQHLTFFYSDFSWPSIPPEMILTPTTSSHNLSAHQIVFSRKMIPNSHSTRTAFILLINSNLKKDHYLTSKRFFPQRASFHHNLNEAYTIISNLFRLQISTYRVIYAFLLARFWQCRPLGPIHSFCVGVSWDVLFSAVPMQKTR